MTKSNGHIALVTGATSGIGNAAALELAKRNLTVVILSRDKTIGENVVAEMKQASGNSQIELLVCDLSSQASIRAAVTEFNRRFDRLDILINCAAVFMAERIATKDHLELMFATNHLGPFLLTNLLLDHLSTSASGRVITVSAPSPLKPHFEDLQGEKNFSPAMAFGRTKAENLLFTYALARRLAGKNITANAFHPGVVRGTHLMQNAPSVYRVIMRLATPLLRTPQKAGNQLADLATSEAFSAITGKLIHDGKPMASPLEKETEIQERLWEESLRLSGLTALAVS